MRTAFAELPQWVQQNTRTMDNGYIVYVGTGVDQNLERARFKAKSMAVRSLVNECTLPHRETRVEDFYDENVEGQHRSYAKVAIQYSDCDEGKRALAPDQIKKLSNRSLAEEQKKYDEILYGDPDQNHRDLVALGAKVTALSDSVDALKEQRDLAKAKQDIVLEPDVYGPESPYEFNKVIVIIVPKTINMRRREMNNPMLLPWQRSLSMRGLRSAYSFRSLAKGSHKKTGKQGVYSHRTSTHSRKTRVPASKPRKHRTP